MTIAQIPQRLKIMTPNELARRVMALEAANTKCGEAIAAAVAAEREACAKVCDKNAREAAAECKRRYSISSDPDHDLIAMKFAAYDGQAQRDAAAIRARSNDPH